MRFDVASTYLVYLETMYSAPVFSKAENPFANMTCHIILFSLASILDYDTLQATALQLDWWQVVVYRALSRRLK